MSSDCNYVCNIEKIFYICGKWVYLCYMKYIKINNEMAKMFSELRESSLEPTFMLSYNGVITHGCKVIQKSKDAVFVHINSFSDCGGFWMPVSTYQRLKDGVLKVSKNAPFNQVNYTQAYYQY